MACERELERAATFTEIHHTLVENDAISENETIIIVDGHRQKIYLMESGTVSASYTCSTGAKGFGNEEGSDKTSTGMMYVSRKIGDGEPVGRVFQYKSPTRYILPEDSGEYAWVCTRVLVLSGHQSRNRNVYQRAIYIHGTNRRSVLGVPASGGCIRMSNQGVINLFSRVSAGTKVFVAASNPEDNPTLPCGDTDRSVFQAAKDKFGQVFRTPDPYEGEDEIGGEPEHD
jgi:L,D-transpeptidase YbiS